MIPQTMLFNINLQTILVQEPVVQVPAGYIPIGSLDWVAPVDLPMTTGHTVFTQVRDAMYKNYGVTSLPNMKIMYSLPTEASPPESIQIAIGSQGTYYLEYTNAADTPSQVTVSSNKSSTASVVFGGFTSGGGETQVGIVTINGHVAGTAIVTIIDSFNRQTTLNITVVAGLESN